MTTVEDWLARALYPHAAWDIERPTQPAIAAMRRCRAKAAAILSALSDAGFAVSPAQPQVKRPLDLGLGGLQALGIARGGAQGARHIGAGESPEPAHPASSQRAGHDAAQSQARHPDGIVINADAAQHEGPTEQDSGIDHAGHGGKIAWSGDHGLGPV